MEWDMKASSSQWDWENLMPFPNKGNDSGKNETSGTDGYGGEGLMGNNGSVYSSSSFGYASSSKSSLSADFLAKPEPDHRKVKGESMESGYTENKNVVFVDLRSQVQPDHESENVKSSKLSLNSSKRGLGTEGLDYEPHKEIDQMGQANARGISTVTDSEIGLRLGKRTYFEDASAIKATSTPRAASGSGAGAVKKRGVCQSMQPPRCQVEGCNTDLSSCKDYHRRHKVCEIHSKTPKVVVKGQDQRFCQQCSRFHVLSEFDEGKRSCRRRLAGHNERRRKPQPDAMALNSTRLDSSFYDGSRTGFLMDRSSFMHPRVFSSSVLDGHNEFKLGHSRGTWPTIIKTDNHFSFDGHLQMPAVNRQSYPNALLRQQADRQLTLLQSSKAASGNLLSQGISNYAQIPVNTVAKALTLTSSSGTGVLGGLEMDSAIESLPGVSDSGRALSLLSSHSWGSRAPGSATLDLVTRPGFTSEEFMHGNHSSMNHIPVQGMQHNFGLATDKFLTISSQSSTGSVSNGYSASAMSTMEKAHHGGPLVDNIGGIVNIESPMHCFLQTQDLRSSQDSRSKEFRCTIDLMQRSSQALSNESQEHSGLAQHGNGQYMEFQLMKSYEPPVFDSQHM